MPVRLASPTLRVLVIDPSVRQRSHLAALISAWGWECQTVAQGAEALTLVLDYQPHVMLIGSEHPDPELFQLLRQLRNSPGMQGVLQIAAIPPNQTDSREALWLSGCHLCLDYPAQTLELEHLLLAKARQQVAAADSLLVEELE